MSPTHDPAISELLSFFDFTHLPPHLAAASEPFHWTAHTMVANPGAAVDVLRSVILRMDSEDGREAASAALKLRRLEVALLAPDYAVVDATGPEDFLRTLLEAKDCAVRAALVRHRSEQIADDLVPVEYAVSDRLRAALLTIDPAAETLVWPLFDRPLTDRADLSEMAAAGFVTVLTGPDDEDLFTANLTARGQRALSYVHRSEQAQTARATAERDHAVFLDSLTPESRERALDFAEKTATGEWQALAAPPTLTWSGLHGYAGDQGARARVESAPGGHRWHAWTSRSEHSEGMTAMGYEEAQRRASAAWVAMEQRQDVAQAVPRVQEALADALSQDLPRWLAREAVGLPAEPEPALLRDLHAMLDAASIRKGPLGQRIGFALADLAGWQARADELAVAAGAEPKRERLADFAADLRPIKP